MKTSILAIIALTTTLIGESFSYTEKATVAYSEPIYKTKTVRIPVRDCYEREVPIERPRQDRNSIGLDTIIGGVIGVAAGNQVNGKHRGAAKVIGGLGGALFANNVFRDNDDDYSGGYQTKTIEECKTTYRSVKEEYLYGYRLTLNYKNRTLNKVSKVDKSIGSTVNVRVSINY